MAFSTPAGTIMPYAGPLTQQVIAGLVATGWLACDGSRLPINPQFQELYQVIGHNYGGDNQTYFNLPDLRGRFVRGTDHGAARDPDRASRTAPAAGGNTGDAVGSSEADATAVPTVAFTTSESAGHQHLVPYQPVTDHHAAKGASGVAAADRMAWVPGTVDTSTAGAHTHSVGLSFGGDVECRPVNIYLFWLIKFNSSL